MRTTQQLLFLCLCLVTQCGFTRTQLHGSGVTIVVPEGSDVILPCSPTTKQNLELKIFDWKKDGMKDVFFYDAGIHYNNGRTGQDEQFKGRVFHFEDELKNGNASIMIRNTKMADSGVYTCHFPRLQPQETFLIRLVVERNYRDRSGEIPGAPRPFIEILNQTIDWSLLQCEVRAASPKPKVEWQDGAGNRIPSEEPQVSRIGDHYDVTLLVNVTKTDHYHCVVKQEEISHWTDAKTFVFLSGAPRPSIKILNQTNDWSLLQCEVRAASPKPKVVWQDSAGNRIPSEEPEESRIGDHYYITLLATVTKTDHYHCVVEQEEISHQTDAETFVFLSEDSTSKVVTGWIGGVCVGLFLGALILVVVQALLIVKNVMTMPRIKGRHQQKDVPPNGSPDSSPNGSLQEPLKKDPV